MVKREFLGWDRPFLEPLVEWLMERRAEIPRYLVTLPTAQAGRRLREALAEKGVGLAPRIVTPGYLLATDNAAPAFIEHLAWTEAIESVRDWSEFEAAFPLPPGEGEAPGWALALAGAMTRLRASLQENGHTISSAARRVASTVEADRWQALAALEERVEKLLGSWGLTSRSVMISQGSLPPLEGVSLVVMAGVPDMPNVLARWLSSSPLTVTILIGAPESEMACFDEVGRPLWGPDGEKYDWNTRILEWPLVGSVNLTADPRQQAIEAVGLAALAQTPSNRLVLGTADEETSGELVRAFGRAGWVAHDPSRLPPLPLAGWLSAWRAFVRNPSTASALDLLGFAQTGALVEGERFQRVAALSSARDRWLSKSPDDLERAVVQTNRSSECESLKLALETMRCLEGLRSRFVRDGFHKGMSALLDVIDPLRLETEPIRDWIAASSSLAHRVKRDGAFWLDLLVATIPEGVAVPPEDRVLDVQGWLELFHEPGPHLIICGMNEGNVPGRASTDAWLSESARRILGLSADASRAARDAFLFAAMIEARRAEGRVDLLLTKTSGSGEALLPSRLLLAASEEQLPARVAALFRGIEPPEASLAWTMDEAWKWRPRKVAWSGRMSVTGFSDYLACPFRFYLKQVLGMSRPEPDRVEWNPRDFGNILHIVLERWAMDEEARDYSKTEAIEEWVHACLDQVVEERFGHAAPLAVRIQTESMRRRLSWFSRVQACERAAGWKIHGVEEKFEVTLGNATVAGRVDRIERHEDGRWRVLDYKTGNAGAAESAHRTAVSPQTRLPAHLENVPAVLQQTSDGKTKRWKNLQLALYSAAFPQIDEIGYFWLGEIEANVGLSLWEEFSAEDRDSALACAEWVIGQAQNQIFWPPAERVSWDDFEALSLGRDLVETVAFEGGAE
jgi:ATP-dependent helicase/nuclease subunit B